MKTFEFSCIGLPRLFITFPRIGWLDPPVFRTHSWEVEPPHRFAPSVIGFYLLPLPRAIAFGWWHDTDVEGMVEEQQLRLEIEEANAAYDRHVMLYGDTDLTPEQFQSARKAVASRGLDPDDEMELMQALGVFDG